MLERLLWILRDWGANNFLSLTRGFVKVADSKKSKESDTVIWFFFFFLPSHSTSVSHLWQIRLLFSKYSLPPPASLREKYTFPFQWCSAWLRDLLLASRWVQPTSHNHLTCFGQKDLSRCGTSRHLNCASAVGLIFFYFCCCLKKSLPWVATGPSAWAPE